MVAPADSEDDPPAGEDVHHGKVFGQADGVPHGQDVEAAAELQVLGELAQVLAQDEQVGDAFVTFPLEVVLRHPQNVISQLIHQDGRFLGDI